MFGIFSLICLFVNQGICSQTWSVRYFNTMKCVLKGSTTLLSGSFTHPEDLTITETFWTINPAKGKETPDLSNDPQYKGRVTYLNKDQNFILKLTNVTDKDENMYCFRIMTDVEKEKYLGYPGVELKVTELRVEIPEEVIEGKSAGLFCKTTCTFANSTKYTWYKNRSPLSESFSTNKLWLQSVSTEDTGNYSCAVREHTDLSSPAVSLTVRYPPKKTSVSISGSGEIVEGDSVNLTCSSDANPPVQIYTWFKESETSAVGSGQSFRALESGRFYCEAQNEYGSQRSAAVSVIFSGGWNKVLHVTAGIVAALICVCVVIVGMRIVSRKTKDSAVRGEISKQENISVAEPSAHPTACDLKTADQNDLMYASIAHLGSCPLSQDQTAGDDGEVQYASVHHHKHTEMNNMDAETQYGNVSNRCPISSRCNAELAEDSSVIYSSIRVT